MSKHELDPTSVMEDGVNDEHANKKQKAVHAESKQEVLTEIIQYLMMCDRALRQESTRGFRDAQKYEYHACCEAAEIGDNDGDPRELEWYEAECNWHDRLAEGPPRTLSSNTAIAEGTRLLNMVKWVLLEEVEKLDVGNETAKKAVDELRKKTEKLGRD